MASSFLRTSSSPFHRFFAQSRVFEAVPFIQFSCKESMNSRKTTIFTVAASTGTASGGTGDAMHAQDQEPRSRGFYNQSMNEIKAALYKALEGTNRGIFGITSAKKLEIEGLVELMESRNPTPHPTDNLSDKVEGCWKVIYSTISILGAKRTKLGLRDFITLGDFLQKVDVAKERAVNVIEFNVRGLKLLSGQLTIEASYAIASKNRVDIKLERSSIVPDQLMDIFEKNYDLLLGIFNPQGWLEITYVDDTMRIGRDDKGNIFVLEKAE